ncbi:MAG: hypothetical protein EA404_06895 [Spirochaetaceae bacterium]|nr:MAG: hypothetical protein EA404_06895 [Spirochaetaceae bacterium]
MKRFEELTRLEQVLLLGIIPILGATAAVGAALTAALVGVVSSLVVWLASRLIPAQVGHTTRWGTLVALGLGLSYALSNIAGYVVPIPSAALVYLYLVGATPLVYVGAGTLYSTRDYLLVLLRYAVVVIGFAVIREPLGQGSVLGIDVWQPGLVPVGILASGTGALLLFASVAFVNHLVSDLKSDSKQEIES